MEAKLETLLEECRLTPDEGLPEVVKRLARRGDLLPLEEGENMFIFEYYYVKGYVIGWTGFKIDQRDHFQFKGQWIASRAKLTAAESTAYQDLARLTGNLSRDNWEYEPHDGKIRFCVNVPAEGETLCFIAHPREVSRAKQKGFERILDLIDGESDWVSVESSNISRIAYTGMPRTLYVQFHNGGGYRYEGVSEDTFNELLAAGSKGRYFASHIKDKYPCEKV